ncbi:ATP-binding cassette domain-containing protein [Phycisphaeraceae bacterium D3-23]
MSDSAGTPVFQLDQATVRYGALDAVAGVALSVARGERVALVGPSGAGKTTLLRLLGASLRATEGSVRIFDEDAAALGSAELRKLRSRIATVPQHLALVPNLRVIRNVLLGRVGSQPLLGSLRATLLPGNERTLEVHEVLERVGIADKLYQRTDKLSGGQQQRVAVARALYQRPTALLADEPVSSVDPSRARSLVELLDGIATERSLTLVMSLHNLDLAREFFPRLVGMRAGRVVFDLPADEICEAQFEALYQLDERELMANGA